MFKKKTIYIVGIVVFTMILLADVAARFLLPTGGAGKMPSFNAGEFNVEDFENTMPENGRMPGGAVGESFNIEDFEGSMPSGGFEGGFGGDFSGFTGNVGNQSSGVFGIIRAAFWPVLIVCILGDAACIFMLICISKKNKDDDDDESDESDDNFPRRDRSNIGLAVIAIILVVAVTISSLPSGEAEGAIEAQSEVVQKEVTLGDISAHFLSSGTLQSSEAKETELPTSVKVTAFYVKNGDTVVEGDTIAAVDKNSVLNAIYEVQTLIGEMDEEISEVQGDTLDSKITSRADGRVKLIYAEDGESVAGAMYDHGAVMLISLGGSMSVEITSDAQVSVGESMTVTLSDGTEIEGKVQLIQNGVITITITDDGPIPGDAVSVAMEDGTVLGEGTLEVSSALKITGYHGTVDDIYVEVDEEVDAGDTLLTLEDYNDHARYEQLLREREELTALEQELAVIYNDGIIKAQQSGIVSGISDDVDYVELSAASLATIEPRVITLSMQALSEGTPPEGDNTTPPAEDTTTPPTGDTTTPPVGDNTTPPAEDTTTPPTGDSTIPPVGDTTPPGQGTVGSIEAMGNGVYAGIITKVTYEALVMKIGATDVTGTDISALETMDETLFTEQKQGSPAADIVVNAYKDGQSVTSSVSEIQSGDKVFIKVENNKIVQIDYIVGTGTSDVPQGSMPGGTGNFDGNTGTGSFGGSTGTGGGMSGSFGSGMTGSFSGGSYGYSQTTEEEEEEATYIVEKTSLYAITPAEMMSIEVQADELDVLSLAVGQVVTVSLDALPGQSVTGSIKKIASVGTNEGGSTKFTVTIEVPRSEQMLDGMNASILVEVSRVEGALTLPAAAINEDGNRTFVYTGYDEDTGELTAPIDVEVGKSDGTNVEIISGLSEGDVVYYQYADTVVYRTQR